MIFCEVLAAAMMIIDVTIYLIMTKCKFSILNSLEIFTITIFILCFMYMLVKGLNKVDEDIEFFLFLIRFGLQCIRLCISIIRV